uniref:ATP-dependent Clp protease proteolytic subunit n=1 Tax=Phyllocladus aspleniifolius TaxID=120602 RepID=A0A3Q9WS21_9CONI|nr:ATP-dependent Clp protease proteolytic subunit [Phyllocladus aspleniifolius]
MPIGVPKVPPEYEQPSKREEDNNTDNNTDNDEEAAIKDPAWTDIFDEIHERRVLFLTKPLDEELANQLIGTMIHLCLDNPKRPHSLFINCIGGYIVPGLAICDSMQNMPPIMNTIGMGICASTGSLILSGGTKRRRYIFKNCRIMVHQPATGWSDQKTRKSCYTLEDLTAIKEQVIDFYLKTTHQKTKSSIWSDLERDKYMNSKQAIRYGISDILIDKKMIDKGIGPWKLSFNDQVVKKKSSVKEDTKMRERYFRKKS